VITWLPTLIPAVVRVIQAGAGPSGKPRLEVFFRAAKREPRAGRNRSGGLAVRLSGSLLDAGSR